MLENIILGFYIAFVIWLIWFVVDELRIFSNDANPTEPEPIEKPKLELGELAKSIINDLDVANKDLWYFSHELDNGVSSYKFNDKNPYTLTCFTIRRYDVEILSLVESPADFRFNRLEKDTILDRISEMWDAKDAPKTIYKRNGVIQLYQGCLQF